MIIFYETKGKDLVYADYCAEIQPMIDNWKTVKTVKVFKGKVYIQEISFHYFTELLKLSGIPFKAIYQF